MGLELQVQLDKETYAPGEEVRGVINVIEGDTARTVEVRIARVEVTADYVETVRSLSVDVVHTGDLATGMAIPFSAPLPADAEPNIVGLGSILWRIEVEVDRRGFNKKLGEAIVISLPDPERRPPPPTGTGPVSAGGIEERKSRAALLVSLIVLVLLGVATFFALQQWMTWDDPVLPSGSAMRTGLKGRFGNAVWLGNITAIEPDDPDPGDVSVDTNLANDAEGEPRARQMCSALLEYLRDQDVEEPTIFIHSTEDSLVKGDKIVFGTDWICETGGLRDF
jgi:hypothetical protein